jgi:hypothetical protein
LAGRGRRGIADALAEAIESGANVWAVNGVGRRQATWLLQLAQERCLPVAATSSLVTPVEGIAHSGSRGDAVDERWSAEVLVHGKVTVTETGLDGYHPLDGSPPRSSWADGELIVEGDYGPIYFYGVSGTASDSFGDSFGGSFDGEHIITRATR